MAYVGGYARAIGRMFIPQYLNLGWSMNKIITQLKSEGLGWRRKVMLSDIREYSGMMKNEYQITHARSDRKLSTRLMTEVTMAQPRRYHVVADASFYNRHTGEMVDRTISWYDNDLRTFGEWVSEYEQAGATFEYDPTFQLTGMKIRAVKHQKGWEY